MSSPSLLSSHLQSREREMMTTKDKSYHHHISSTFFLLLTPSTLWCAISKWFHSFLFHTANPRWQWILINFRLHFYCSLLCRSNVNCCCFALFRQRLLLLSCKRDSYSRRPLCFVSFGWSYLKLPHMLYNNNSGSHIVTWKYLPSPLHHSETIYKNKIISSPVIITLEWRLGDAIAIFLWAGSM